uniref:ST8 alpha-N-acetyl-neuraminide alpha-2,8-sialyltransferase 3 n=1 Tax=Sus scrofa TaxID=9823 RepID=A0A8D2CHU3_PIG
MRNCKMARVASVLGLVMLSVALLILSLISYVSLKKENIFTTPKYANPGAPRMYMFHAGFRSQFALKFLDPSFVPFPHSLTHELQDRPKWTFNRTAFLHQRQEILQHVDVIKNFSLTKNSVRIGQLMHYDYSSHKYVFSISNNFRSLLPDVSPIVNKHYNICAVVGNSGILTGSRCGQQIDKSDFVFRCNFAPTEAFQRDVGRKTNLTTFNPSILEKYYNNLLTIQDRNNFFLSLKKLDGAILWIPAFFFHTSATVTRTLVDFFVEHRGQLKVQLAWPGNIMQHVNRFTPQPSNTAQIHKHPEISACGEAEERTRPPISLPGPITPGDAPWFTREDTQLSIMPRTWIYTLLDFICTQKICNGLETPLNKNTTRKTVKEDIM